MEYSSIIVMRFNPEARRKSEVVSLKIYKNQRAFLEEQALGRKVSLCEVVRQCIDKEMDQAGAMPGAGN